MMQPAVARNVSPRRERGDGLVEFALILPVLMLLIMGIVDLGRAVYAYNVVANCAREGARYGLVAPTDDSGMIAAAKSAAVGLDTAQITVTVTHPSSDSIKVEVRYNFQVATPLVANILSDGGSLLLSSVTTMYTGY